MGKLSRWFFGSAECNPLVLAHQPHLILRFYPKQAMAMALSAERSWLSSSPSALAVSFPAACWLGTVKTFKGCTCNVIDCRVYFLYNAETHIRPSARADSLVFFGETKRKRVGPYIVVCTKGTTGRVFYVVFRCVYEHQDIKSCVLAPNRIWFEPPSSR